MSTLPSLSSKTFHLVDVVALNLKPVLSPLARLVAAYEENQKLQKESETSKTTPENGYDR